MEAITLQASFVPWGDRDAAAVDLADDEQGVTANDGVDTCARAGSFVAPDSGTLTFVWSQRPSWFGGMTGRGTKLVLVFVEKEKGDVAPTPSTATALESTGAMQSNTTTAVLAPSSSGTTAGPYLRDWQRRRLGLGVI